MPQYLLLDSESALARALRGYGVDPPWPTVIVAATAGVLACCLGVWLVSELRPRRQRGPRRSLTRRSGVELVRGEDKAEEIAEDAPGAEGEDDLPKGWSVAYDAERGAPYYYNERLRASTWTRPIYSEPDAALPGGWDEYTDDLGRKYFYNRRERSSTWTHPETLPAPSPRTAMRYSASV